jgi:hypothetical protein
MTKIRERPLAAVVIFRWMIREVFLELSLGCCRQPGYDKLRPSKISVRSGSHT